jgi:hypothetical protein
LDAETLKSKLNFSGLSSTKCADLQTGESKAAVGEAVAACTLSRGAVISATCFAKFTQKTP